MPYANAIPHVGHAIEFFQADAYARYFKKKLGKENVFFNVGVDEHGLKVFTTAHDHDTTPEKYLDALVPEWLSFCSKFRIEHDHFYRTSAEDHHVGSKRVWEICNEKGDIYKKHYEGLYCVGCESFYLERDLIDGKCPDHGTVPVKYSEENYFFQLSKYSQAIISYLEENPDFLKPAAKKQELLNFLKDMEDISISRNRKNLPWGIEVPNDPEHTIYVWFDALTNYIRVLGFDNDLERFNSWWPGIQICGPDNLRFQGAIWQGMLAALGLPFTKKLLVHGTIFGPDGQKMSKTIGNVVSPLEQYEKYGSDICRFYMLGVLRPYTDSSYREEDLKEAYNAHLANSYGNLLNRIIHLGNQKDIDILDASAIESDFKAEVDEMKNKAEKAYEDFELHDAVSIINEIVSKGNQFVHEKEPWKQEAEDAKITLNNVSYLIQVASELYEPIIPDGAQKAIETLHKKEKLILFPRMK
ncbi:MAG: methionine--tRNA ligase [Candidatus Latescibacteria bacterium]|nr:methionine--tRNA ligase [Candidatus Latescibacterota bacterium]MBT4140659.1 methionine--tRNA ligase [Candidatus Latescibacterota bacterium]MBT5832451.1 methionine--tRNA ligase [Candidatus Latescibacterota bacterium]